MYIFVQITKYRTPCTFSRKLQCTWTCRIPFLIRHVFPVTAGVNSPVITCVAQYANPPLAFTYIYARFKIICVFAYIISVYFCHIYPRGERASYKKKLTAVVAIQACMLCCVVVCMPAAAALLLLLYLNMKSHLETEPGSRNLEKS